MTQQEIKDQTLKRALKIFEIWKEAGTPTTPDLLPILKRHGITLSECRVNLALSRAIKHNGYGKPRPIEQQSHQLFSAT